MEKVDFEIVRVSDLRPGDRFSISMNGNTVFLVMKSYDPKYIKYRYPPRFQYGKIVSHHGTRFSIGANSQQFVKRFYERSKNKMVR